MKRVWEVSVKEISFFRRFRSILFPEKGDFVRSLEGETAKLCAEVTNLIQSIFYTYIEGEMRAKKWNIRPRKGNIWGKGEKCKDTKEEGVKRVHHFSFSSISGKKRASKM